jgi:UDP-N-acetylglucosamine acyltransferase
MIAESAKVDKSVILGKNVKISPFAIISAKTKIEDNVKIGPYVFIEGNVEIGEECVIGPGAIIGSTPLDYNFKGEVSKVRIGKRNIIREYSTIHRATGKNKATLIGDDNFIMAYVHIAHNCKIGNNTVITNCSQLAGYVEVDDNANIGGMVGIHQYVRVGKLALVGACSYLSKDLPPYLIGQGNPFQVLGLNLVGLRREHFNQKQIALLTKAYRLIYRSKFNLSQALIKIKQELPMTEDLKIFLDFLGKSKRGIELTD